MRIGPGGWIGVAAVVTAALLATLIRLQSATHVVAAGFWYDGVTFDVPGLDAHGGPLSDAERAAIRDGSRVELERAFAGLRLRIVDGPDAHYRVRVLQRFAERRHRPFGVAESRAFGAIGGDGAVSFSALAAMAVHLAPAGTPRAEVVAAIGRGIGRVAAHELAHQILSNRDIHASTDPASYEFADVNRPVALLRTGALGSRRSVAARRARRISPRHRRAIAALAPIR